MHGATVWTKEVKIKMPSLLKTALLMCIVLMPLGWATPLVKEVRVGQHAEKTRVVLESNQPLKPKVFTLTNPNRVVLDFSETKFKDSLSTVKYPPGSLVRKMRQGLFKPGTIRMVLDTNQATKPRVFSIPAAKDRGFRLVIDLLPTDQAVIKQPAQVLPKPIPAPVSQPARKANQGIVIVIDPGHGGVDPGAVGRHKTYEKNIVLEVSKKLQKKLEKMPNTHVYLTRNKDMFIKLSDRVKFAQEKQADLFISLHADAHKSRKVKGGSVYILSEKASDKEAARLAQGANEGDIVAGIDMAHETPEVRNILLDLTQRETMNQSALLGRHILENLKKIAYVRKDHVLFAGFRVLKAPEIPSALIEIAYLSNPNEEKLLRTESYQNKVASSIAKGVETYLLKYKAY